MCGIAGIYRSSGVGTEDVEAVARMTNAQIHRGPDAKGHYQGERAVLATGAWPFSTSPKTADSP